jgi:hypothetical protein
MSSDGSDDVLSDGSATSGEEYVPVKKKQKTRQPSTRRAAQNRGGAKRAAYVEVYDDADYLYSESSSAEEADADDSEDQVPKACHVGSGAMTHRSLMPPLLGAEGS